MILSIFKHKIEVLIHDVTMREELHAGYDKVQKQKKTEELAKCEKKAKGGLRKCPGHPKTRKHVTYDEDGICSLCRGVRKDG